MLCVRILGLSLWMAMVVLLPLSGQTIVHVALGPESFLKISGLTNVNSFCLTYGVHKDILTLSPQFSLGEKRSHHVQNANLHVPLERFVTANAAMKEEFLLLLQEKTYPNILISVGSIQADSISTTRINGYAEVKITLAGVTRNYTIKFQSAALDQNLVATGHQILNMRDFNLVPPTRLFGLVQVKENIAIDFQLYIVLLSP